MKLGITLWKPDPSKPNPFSPVQRARKFSAVFGTSLPYRPMVTLHTHTNLLRTPSFFVTTPSPRAVLLKCAIHAEAVCHCVRRLSSATKWPQQLPSTYLPIFSSAIVTSKYTFWVIASGLWARAATLRAAERCTHCRHEWLSQNLYCCKHMGPGMLRSATA